MEPDPVVEWLDNAMIGENVVGAALVDTEVGLCIGLRGVAIDSDGAVLTIAARSALDKDGVGAVSYKEYTVLLRRTESGLLVAIFKQMPQGSDEEGE